MASTSNSSTVYSNVKVPLFEGENYDFWTIKMETLFTSLDVLEFVQNGYEEPAPTEAEESSQRLEELKKKKKITDAGVLRMIQRAVADLEEAWAEEETHEEEEEARMAEDGMKEHQINDAKSIRVTLTTRMIVGTRANHNVTIARDSGIFKRIVVLSFNNMLHLQKEKMMKVICSLLVKNAFHEDKNVWYLDSGCSNHMTGK
ncbi:hypothetical protein KIW84_023801 [Lathyrus oleraceus]|uniref:DUF4219 domain-containing protein n=1 Tax=Pisum sativum TaxID=3888 RepID=A0A9D4YIF2_PEA|nr:hypothetical protein KIW84_023801 [Pisum sativum]